MSSCKAQERSINLPSPELDSETSIEKALAQRRSVRDFTDQTLDNKQISQLLWSAQGITAEWGGRTAPSAGATYPIEIYIAVNNSESLIPGLYKYENTNHSLWLIKKGSLGKKLSQACLGQESIQEAPVAIIITAVLQRTAVRYGERAQRYVYMEAGHVGQNIYLQAESLGLGTVVIGAFHDDQVQEVLGINEEVMIIMPVGRIK
ncbi:MAG: SagB/ThcOx family dehydrogenase [bacterium]